MERTLSILRQSPRIEEALMGYVLSLPVAPIVPVILALVMLFRGGSVARTGWMYESLLTGEPPAFYRRSGGNEASARRVVAGARSAPRGARSEGGRERAASGGGGLLGIGVALGVGAALYWLLGGTLEAVVWTMISAVYVVPGAWRHAPARGSGT